MSLPPLVSKPSRKVLYTILSRRKHHLRLRVNCYSTLSSPSEPKILQTDTLFDRINWKKLMDDTTAENVKRRQDVASVDKLRLLWNQLKAQPDQRNSVLESALVKEALRFPNDIHQASVDCGGTPRVLQLVGTPLQIDNPKDLQELCEPRGYLKRNNLGDLIGVRAYILQGFLAELEQALILYTMNFLKDDGFQFISVPDLLHAEIIESCGFPVLSDRTMVYEIDTEEGENPIYLSGTSELAMGGYLSNKTFTSDELPLKLAAVSRCFRAETSSIEEERGIYRVHNFSKVEMFAVTKPDDSDHFHDHMLNLQSNLFSSLGLHFQVLEMPPNDLGFPAYRKFDIEAWMPGRKQFGEISSCSNCTDYQSRRLNIRYDRGDFTHTLNGTACAIPRMLIAIIESCQTPNNDLVLPPALEKLMVSKWVQDPPKTPTTAFMKNRKLQEKVVLRYDPWRAILQN